MGGEEGNVLITANKMDGVLPVWHSPHRQPREGAASFRARPVSWDVHFPLTECGEGRGTRARGRREAISSALAICLPGPAVTPSTAALSLAACGCGKVPRFSGLSFVLCEWWGKVEDRLKKSSTWTGFQESLKLLELHAKDECASGHFSGTKSPLLASNSQRLLNQRLSATKGDAPHGSTLLF